MKKSICFAACLFVMLLVATNVSAYAGETEELTQMELQTPDPGTGISKEDPAPASEPELAQDSETVSSQGEDTPDSKTTPEPGTTMGLESTTEPIYAPDPEPPRAPEPEAQEATEPIQVPEPEAQEDRESESTPESSHASEPEPESGTTPGPEPSQAPEPEAQEAPEPSQAPEPEAQEAPEPIQAPEPSIAPELETQEDAELELAAAKTVSYAADYLFIGNSLTFYNNLPSMFQQMVEAGTGEKITYAAAVYGGRTMEEHAKAIAAVIRTKGVESKLTKTEKTYFYASATNQVYSSAVYQGYVDAFWDKTNQCPKQYKNIILQPYYKSGKGDGSVESLTGSVSSIMNSLNAASSNYVLNSTWTRYTSTLPYFSETQEYIDSVIDGTVASLQSSSAAGKYASLKTVYSGKAFSNYLSALGLDYAQNIEPEAYAIYKNTNGVMNDLISSDLIHPTQLGTYIEAACYYSVLYGNAQETSAKYTGGVTDSLRKVDGNNGTNLAVLYNNGNGLTNKGLTSSAAQIADNTARIAVTFDGNGAEVNTFGTKTYSYADTSVRFTGTIQRTGYKMLGWSYSKNAAAADFIINRYITVKFVNKILRDYNGSVTLYAVWQPEQTVKTIRVTFNGNGAVTNTFGTKTYSYADTSVRFAGTIRRPGYKMLGWSFSRNAKKAEFVTHRYITVKFVDKVLRDYNGSVTLYAVWQKQ